jgi:hypothetical protein
MVLNVHQAPQGGMRIADQLADEGFVAGSHGGADFIYRWAGCVRRMRRLPMDIDDNATLSG